ncbi:putative calcium-binding protein CML21 [Apostasia shenzhenica]|uniref:Putative calcium-binding protein CML21 n=1 Tax=Apostasia shenzhenica TaxID=1088818 RepID=A0A2I0A6P8_9ASPA|nr:putative calcium-binding protein CML21 [Apostasia shenzhenica]
MGAALRKNDSSSHKLPFSKLEAKMVEAMRHRAARGSTMKSFNSIIMKFPKIDESFRNCKAIFEQFDEDSNGAIDLEELKHCFDKLQVDFTDEEIGEIFKACDMDENMGIKFNEFIVLICLVYLLKEPTTVHANSRLDLPELEATFQTLVDAFVFLDKNKDGHVSKSEMVTALNESSSGGRSSGRIAMRRFHEMDWDKNGMVTFKEFLFAFTRWLGIGGADEDGE